VSPVEILASPITTPRFIFHRAPLAGVWRVQRSPIGDARGFFSRFYCAQEFAAIGITAPLVQINHSLCRLRGTVRGLHFQHAPHAETKVVTCIAGHIFDVAVDLRLRSPTFLHWFGTELSAENQQSLVIPPGFAHGYQALTDDCELIYLHTAAYHPAAEAALNATDPRVSIAWPLEITEMSDRDRGHAMLTAEFEGIEP
jgi:dTDP-4-dehydrorhamnose 3,5-epimerase